MRRRDCLGLGAALATGAARAARAATPTRIVALEWSIVSMLLSLGVPPVGMPEISAYREWVAEPVPPGGVADIGIKTEPNLETVAGLRPDLILTSPLNRAIKPLLRVIAPVREVPIYTDAAAPLRIATEQLTGLSVLLGRTAEADAEIASAKATFARSAEALQARRDRPVVILSFLDAQHARVFGRGSLFADVLQEVGLANAWTQPVNLWGFVVVGIAELARYPEARLLVVEPTPPGVMTLLNRATLWSSLPAVRAGRLAVAPAAWQSGDLVAARRFAGFLPKALGAAA